MTDQNEPILLRVKRGSEFEKALIAGIEGDITEDEMSDVGGMRRTGPVVRRVLPGWFDNLQISSRREGDEMVISLDYYPLQPPKAIVETVNTGGVAPSVPEEISNGYIFPQPPPLIDSMGDKFIEPSWFSMMKHMVKSGRHISLAGPPGTGKDTAVQELAAREGKVLVTVGGDAGFRRRDITGSVHISQGHSYFEVAEYAAAVINGWWALISEVNAADADALMFINTQLAPPYAINIGGKSYPVHPNFRLFVTYNHGLVGTKPLPQSFKDRFFSIKLPFFTEYQLGRILSKHGMPDDAVYQAFPKFGVVAWEAHERGAIRYQITSRRLMDAVELLKSGIVDNYVDAIEEAVISSVDSPLEADALRKLVDQVEVDHRVPSPDRIPYSRMPR